MPDPLRITLDTNQLVRALMRPPRLATFVMAWEASRFSVICSPELLDEYERVLSHPDIAALIYPELLRAFRSHLVHDLELIALPEIPRICRDPDDDKVIATAIFGRADYLVSADNDLRTPSVLKVLGSAGISVVTMNELIEVLDQRSR